MAPNFQLSLNQRKSLRALSDAFLPALDDTATAEIVRRQLAIFAARPGDRPCAEACEQRAQEVVRYCRTSGSELGVAEAIEDLFLQHAPPDICLKVKVLLSALATRAGTLAVCGFFTPFPDLDAASKERALLNLASSAIADKRKAFTLLRSLFSFKTFARRGLWDAIGYEGPEPPEQVEAALDRAGGRPEHMFQMLNSTIKGDSTLDYDVVIVGSGCGGAVVASELSKAGHRVLVMEKGPYVRRADMGGLEGEALQTLYEKGGIQFAEDSGVAVLSGAAFGGGSTVNWACSLRTPEHVRQEWAQEHGLKCLAGKDFTRSLDTVCARIGVTAEGVAHNRNNQVLLDGCRRCGYSIEVAPQNMADVSAGAPGANYIGHGDRYGLKQNMTETFLRDAANNKVPTQFVDRCRVRRVIHEGGVAKGVQAEVIGDGGKPYRLDVKARAVVVSCGAVNSPALLLRSKLPNKNGLIGKNLRLHPVVSVFGRMPAGSEDVNDWKGAPMTLVSNEVAGGTLGDHYGAKLECPAFHPGFCSATFWQGGKELKERMLDMRRTAMQIVLVRDRESGEVRLDSQGESRLYYPLGAHDRESLHLGIEACIRALAAAGVESIHTGQGQALGGGRDLPPVEMAEERQRAVEALIAEGRKAGFPVGKAQVASAHQMGTCRMGSNAKDSVVGPTGESWEVSGLFVADASTFPTSSGVNPMVTTLAMAHFIAQQMKQKLHPTSRL